MQLRLFRPAFIALLAQPPTTQSSPPPNTVTTSCQAAATMTTIADNNNNNNNNASKSSLPRWDLGRFGFATPFSKDIDAHLDETAKLAESFKVRDIDCRRYYYFSIYICIFIIDPLITSLFISDQI